MAAVMIVSERMKGVTALPQCEGLKFVRFGVTLGVRRETWGKSETMQPELEG